MPARAPRAALLRAARGGAVRRKEREKREADELRKATEAVTGVTDGVLAPADRWVYNKNLQILQILDSARISARRIPCVRGGPFPLRL